MFDENALEKNQPIITYGMIGDGLAVPAEGLLTENFIRDQIPIIHQGDFPKLFFSKNSAEYSFDFDLFAATFYMATEYEKYIRPVFDSYGRYQAGTNRETELGLYQQPLLHQYA